jgi:glutathione S-transferase
MPPLLLKLVLARLPLIGKVATDRVQPMIDNHLDWLESELTAREWFAGDAFTAADVMMSFPLEAARGRGGLGGSRPRLIDWIDRIHTRPAYQTALAVGGPYAYA